METYERDKLPVPSWDCENDVLDVPSAATILADRGLPEPYLMITEKVVACHTVAVIKPLPVAPVKVGLANPVTERTRNLP